MSCHECDEIMMRADKEIERRDKEIERLTLEDGISREAQDEIRDLVSTLCGQDVEGIEFTPLELTKEDIRQGFVVMEAEVERLKAALEKISDKCSAEWPKECFDCDVSLEGECMERCDSWLAKKALAEGVGSE